MARAIPKTSQVELFLGLGLMALAALGGCGHTSTAAAPAPVAAVAPQNVLASVVFLGDSLTAGFQNGSLLDTEQVHGFANLVATQAGFAITLPLVAAPGVPEALTLESDGPLPTLGQEGGVSNGRENPSVQATDLGVPGDRLTDVINGVPSPGNVLTNLVLGYPQGNTNSQLQEAVALQPSAIFLWIGSNDALVADEQGSASAMTPLADFTAQFTQLMTTLKTQTKAHLVVANITDVTAVPYMTPASTVIEAVAGITGITQAQSGTLLGLDAGDLVNQAGIFNVEKQLNGLAKGASLQALPGSEVLTPAEVLTIQGTINSYNQVIAQQVSAAGGTLVDLHAFVATFAAGVSINGYTATTGYLGGLFGLDGEHPTNTGYALLANQFIATLNTAFQLSIPAVNVAQVAASDPYFGSNIKPVGAVARVPWQVARQMSMRHFEVVPR